jgi:hypothetical protein
MKFGTVFGWRKMQEGQTEMPEMDVDLKKDGYAAKMGME